MLPNLNADSRDNNRTRWNEPSEGAGPQNPEPVILALVDQAIAEQTIRRIMRTAGFAEDKDDQLVFSAADNTSGRTYPAGDTPASRKFVQSAKDRAREVERAVPGARTSVDVVDQWVNISVTMPPEAKKSPKQLDREIAEALAKPRASSRKIGYGLSAIDDDEWSWSVEALREGQTAWGTGSDTIAEGVEYTKAEAVANIKKALASLGVDVKDAVRLPF